MREWRSFRTDYPVTIEKVENGWVLTGHTPATFGTVTMVATTLDEVFALLWRTYCKHSVGEDMPEAMRAALRGDGDE